MRLPVRPVLAIALAAAAAATVLAYPISPQPLWTLTAEAELIVVAEVERVEPLPFDEGSWVSAVAHLRVLETVKGRRRDTVEVAYAANLMCPAPPRYEEGETMVAFLARDDGRWMTVGLSYGTLYPAEGEVGDLTATIRAALRIQRNPAKPALQQHRKREWAVHAAALPATRWHGLYELLPGADRIRSFYDDSGRSPELPITARQRALLADAFVDLPKMDPTYPMMLRVLGDHPDPRVDQAAQATLEGLLALDEPPWWSRDLMWAVLTRLGDPRVEAREKECDWESTPEDLRRLWNEAKAELELEELPAAEIELERYIPVGGRTPS